MSNPVISVEHLSKAYRLGQIGTGTLSYDLNVWWAKMRGKPNPLLRIGEQDYGNRDGETIWALKDVSFIVEQGEVLGIIGRNGAGKSTLLKILSRVTAPTSGKIKVKGRVASLLEVGTGFHPDLTGRENTHLNGAILGMSRKEIDRKFDEIVDFAEIEKFIDTPVKRYSSGMYVRLAFAVAAHLEPEILLVDEVLAVGDAAFQKKCLGKMGKVAEEGRTVVFVSHNLTQINKLCKKAIWLDKGCCQENGAVNAVLNSYRLAFEKRTETISSEDSLHGFIGWKVLDDNRKSNLVQIGEHPTIIEVYFKLSSPLSNGFVGITIQTTDGLNITGRGIHNLCLDVGMYKAIFHFNYFPLRSGVYLLFASLWDGGKMIDAKTLFPEITVNNPNDDVGLSEYWAGNLSLPCESKVKLTEGFSQ